MLRVEHIQCHYDGQAVIDDISFAVDNGDISCLLGPSGCGKTTALRAIAGFQPISRGTISLNGQLLSSNSSLVEPDQRHIGMVFQDYALFPHLNVKDNIGFGISKLSGSQRRAATDRLLAMTQLEGLQNRFPHELSGGQQQRVALARALAPNPKLLLLDEPFSNLDIDLRKHLNIEVREILKECGISAILVTHDQEEAFAFGDHIGLLYQGKLQQWDTPFKLYHEPCNRFVANFIGQGCLLPGLALESGQIKTELGILTGKGGKPWQANTLLDVLLRPDDVVLAPNGGIPVTVEKKNFSGSSTLYTLRLPTGSSIEALLPSHSDFSVGAVLQVEPAAEHLIAFPQADQHLLQ